jgi:hypothetical protein
VGVLRGREGASAGERHLLDHRRTPSPAATRGGTEGGDEGDGDEKGASGFLSHGRRWGGAMRCGEREVHARRHLPQCERQMPST